MRKVTHSFEVHLNESACRKKVRLGLEKILLRAELYFPTWKYILQSNTFSDLISVEVLYEFRVEFRYERKDTGRYVSDIKGSKSMNNVSKTERVAYRGIDAGKSISEILYASSTVGLKVGCTIRLDHFSA